MFVVESSSWRNRRKHVAGPGMRRRKGGGTWLSRNKLFIGEYGPTCLSEKKKKKKLKKKTCQGGRAWFLDSVRGVMKGDAGRQWTTVSWSVSSTYERRRENTNGRKHGGSGGHGIAINHRASRAKSIRQQRQITNVMGVASRLASLACRKHRMKPRQYGAKLRKTSASKTVMGGGEGETISSGSEMAAGMRHGVNGVGNRAAAWRELTGAAIKSGELRDGRAGPGAWQRHLREKIASLSRRVLAVLYISVAACDLVADSL